MQNGKFEHQLLALEVSLHAGKNDREVIIEFRRFVLRTYRITLGRIDVFKSYPSEQFNYCLITSHCSLYMLANELTTDFLEVVDSLSLILYERLSAMYEVINLQVVHHYKNQLFDDAYPWPSQVKIEFCKQWLGLPTSLARLACLLAAGGSTESVQQHLGVSKTTLRTYLHRLVRHSGTSSQQQMISWLMQGPLPWIK